MRAEKQDDLKIVRGACDKLDEANSIKLFMISSSCGHYDVL